jgi:hypothetical protein
MLLYQDTLAAGQSITLDDTSVPALTADTTVRIVHTKRITAFVNASDGGDPVKVYERGGADAIALDVVGDTLVITAGDEDVKLTVTQPD